MKFLSILLASVFWMFFVFFIVYVAAGIVSFVANLVGLRLGQAWGLILLTAPLVMLPLTLIYAAFVSVPFVTHGADIGAPILTLAFCFLIMYFFPDIFNLFFFEPNPMMMVWICVSAIPHYLVMRSFIKKQELANTGKGSTYSAVTQAKDIDHA